MTIPLLHKLKITTNQKINISWKGWLNFMQLWFFCVWSNKICFHRWYMWSANSILPTPAHFLWFPAQFRIKPNQFSLITFPFLWAELVYIKWYKQLYELYNRCIIITFFFQTNRTHCNPTKFKILYCYSSFVNYMSILISN